MAPEGRIIFVPLFGLAILSSLAYLALPLVLLGGIAVLLWVLCGFVMFFFRDPTRNPPDDQRAVTSPADGRIVAIQAIGHDPHIDAEAVQVSIFLSLFNVHAQRVPVDAQVQATTYQHGRFLAAFKSAASLENEQAITHFTANEGKFIVKQIAGVLARRIICYMSPDRSAQRGDRLGFIRFGSRVDFIVPANFQLLVQVGDRVKGAVTNMWYFKS